VIARLRCPSCGTEVHGAFAPRRLINLPEPHASLLELFVRLRGNVKEMERVLGLSYPTVRNRLEEAFAAARPKLEAQPPPGARRADAASGAEAALAGRRAVILGQLERDEIGPSEAIARMREVQHREDWRTR